MQFDQKQFQTFALALVTILAVTYLAATGIIGGDAALAVVAAAGGVGAGYQTGKRVERGRQR